MNIIDRIQAKLLLENDDEHVFAHRPGDRAKYLGSTSNIQHLEIGAADPDVSVRKAIAENPNTPQHVVDSLATDPSPYVRHSLAYHPRFSDQHVINAIDSRDKSELVPMVFPIAKKKLAATTVMRYIDRTYTDATSFNINRIAHIAKGINGSKDLYELMAAHSNPLVRAASGATRYAQKAKKFEVAKSALHELSQTDPDLVARLRQRPHPSQKTWVEKIL